jgi:cytidylate kinase
MINDADRINLSVSGWPGSGGTTISMVLSYAFDRKYLYIGNVYRYLGTKLGFSDKGINRPQFDEYIEGVVGKTIDEYTDFKLINSDSILLDSDIGVFRIGKHPKVFSIFLAPPFEQRKERLKEDKLQMEFLDTRDSVLRSKYKELWDIDFFYLETINLKHNLVLNNSNMSIASELKIIIDAIKEYGSFSICSNDYFKNIYNKGIQMIDLFNNKGREAVLNKLKKSGLFFTPKDIIRDISITYPEEVSQFPDHIKKIFFPKI